MQPQSRQPDGPLSSVGKRNRKRPQRYIEGEGRVTAQPRRNDEKFPTKTLEVAAPLGPAHVAGLGTVGREIDNPCKFQEGVNRTKGPGAKVDKLFSPQRASKPPPAMPLPRTSSSSSITSPFRYEGSFASAGSSRSSQTIQERNVSLVENEMTLWERELYNPQVMLPEGCGENLTTVESSRRIRQKTGGFQTQEQAKAGRGNANMKKLDEERQYDWRVMADRQKLKLPGANIPPGSVYQPSTAPQNPGRNGVHVTSKQGVLKTQGPTRRAESPTSSISTRDMDDMLHHFILD